MKKVLVIILVLMLSVTTFLIRSDRTEADMTTEVMLQLTKQKILIDEPVQLQIKVTNPAIKELQFRLPEGLQVVEKESQIDKLTVDETTNVVTLKELESDNSISLIAIQAGDYPIQATVSHATGNKTSNQVMVNIAEKKVSDKVTVAEGALTSTIASTTTSALPHASEVPVSLPKESEVTTSSSQASESKTASKVKFEEKQSRVMPPALFNNENNPPFSELDVARSFHIVTGKNSSIHPTNKSQAIITENKKSQSGGMWYKKQVDMTKDFDLKMSVYLGDNPKGADGMTFVIQNDSRGLEAIGEPGAGLGAYNTKKGNYIKNAVALEFDTFYNSSSSAGSDRFVNKKAENRGHIAVQIPGNKNGSTEADHMGLQIATANEQILANDTWRTLQVEWNATTQMISYYFDNYTPIHYKVDDVEKTFGGTMAYWGFTGSTGSYTNFHSASIIQLPDQNKVALNKSVKNLTTGGLFAEAEAVSVGDKVRYRVQVSNSITNRFESLNALVSDELDERLQYNGGSLTINGKAMSDAQWNNGQISLGTVQPGETFDIQFDATVKTTGEIINKARYQAEYEMPHDTNSTFIRTGQLQVHKKDGDSKQGIAGVTYRMNNAAGTVLEKELLTDKQGNIRLENLLPGEYSLTETKAAPGYLIDGTTHQFTIKDDQSEGPTVVNLLNYRAPRPQLTKTTNRLQVGYQDVIEYTLTASLPKDSGRWEDVMVEDDLPSFLTFVKSDEPTTVEGQTIRWSVGQLKAGEQKQLKLSVRVSQIPPTEMITNKARATGDNAVGQSLDPLFAYVENKYVGKLALTSVPQSFDFGSGLTSKAHNQTYSMQSYQDDLIVTDTRIKQTKWVLSVKMKQQLHVGQAELANTIHFENEAGQLIRVTTVDVPLYTESNQAVETVLSDRWKPTGSGFKLVVPGGKGAPGDYKGILGWTLSDAPR
ncbi:lectin-like domain-containing protein [Brochothrix campestris]|uniref:Legume lectin domain-containing protein n=1 Tax=Brochothrix campestris FSL F6-1037 TaxID=1265861 RepID=W7CS95_9LIST|nr:SpaA isopeptide-forming pilin-related protein [Brochothrix campestris]EUJ39555.1 legume lectin domain-containing protein [Brochothrix campestris FSL F6-1037]